MITGSADERFDVAVVGAGFAGSLLARLLARRGRRVVLFERGRHPRFALGESSTPLAAIALERLARDHGLPELEAFAAWGRWRDVHPELTCGLKRGFTFYGHRRGEPYANSAADERRLLVAASPDDEVADVHWLRADVDARFAERARLDGVTLIEECEVIGVEVGERSVRFELKTGGERLRVDSGFVVDASGPAAVIARGAGARAVASGEARSLVYGHFADVEPFDAGGGSGSGALFEPGPYPDHRAAVHHLFEGGWMYVLPFDDGVVSAGFVLGERPQAATAEEAWRACLAALPSVERSFRAARAVVGPRVAHGLRRRLDRAAGARWAALPHAFSFVDPLFSTGIAWSLVAVERLAGLLLETPDEDRLTAGLARYERLLIREHEQILALVRGAERRFGDFDRFVEWAKLYFVAASWCEARQRLVDPPDAGWEGFLGIDDPVLDGLFDRAEKASAGERAKRDAGMAELAAERDIGGFTRAGIGRRIGVDLGILVKRSGYLGLSAKAARAALPRLRGLGKKASRP